MIEFNEVITAGKGVISDKDMNKIIEMEENADPRILEFITGIVLIAERQALDSVYNGDCDLAVFSHYKNVRNFGNKYMDYRLDKYDITT